MLNVKKGRRQKSYLFVLVLVILIVLLVNTLPGFAENTEAKKIKLAEKAKKVFSLRLNEIGDNQAAIITKEELIVHQIEPEEIQLSLIALDTKVEAKVKLKEITISDEAGRIRTRLFPEIELESINDIAPSEADILSLLMNAHFPKHKELFERSYFNPIISVPVDEFKLKDGESIKLFTTVTFEVEKETRSTTAQTLVTIAALPTATYWYGGDGHVHSDWSPDVIGPNTSINARTSYAAANGFKWIAITDHSNGIGNNWLTYVSQCNSAQSTYGIPVLPGAEITAKQWNTTLSQYVYGDCLGYWLSTTASTIPANWAYICQGLITAINNHNPGYSYAVIAHPYGGGTGAVSWPDWSVTGFRAIELLSNEIQASTATIDKWFSILRANLPSVLAGGRFVVGIGNSDCHYITPPGEAGFTWVYSTTYSPTNRGGIWAAIKAGRCSASGRKDLGYFTVNGAQQGSKIVATGATVLNFAITQRPVTGRKCTQLTIRNKNNTILRTISNPTTTTTNVLLYPPAADDFYIVKFVFATTASTDYSHVWTNPIFVDRI